MKQILFLSFFCLLAACTQDSYESGDGELSALTADFAEMNTDGDTLLVSALTDDGRVLTLTRRVRVRWAQVPDSTYRAIFYYKRADESGFLAEPYSLQPVPVANALGAEHFTDGVQQDPVTLESFWLSKNHQWLNVALLLRTGSLTDDQQGHILGVVRDTLLTAADGRRTLCLTLHHQQNGVPEYYSQHAYFSLSVASLSSADSVRLSVATYQGPVLRTLSLH